MTRKIHKRSKVSRTESTNEPRQPSRLEKKRNTHAGCPTGHGQTRGVSGVSGSTTGGTTGGSAGTPSGGNLPFTGLPVWMPLLAAAAMLGSGIFLIRRRKGEVS